MTTTPAPTPTPGVYTLQRNVTATYLDDLETEEGVEVTLPLGMTVELVDNDEQLGTGWLIEADEQGDGAWLVDLERFSQAITPREFAIRAGRCNAFADIAELPTFASIAALASAYPEVFDGGERTWEDLYARVDAVNGEGNYHEFVVRPTGPVAL